MNTVLYPIVVMLFLPLLVIVATFRSRVLEMKLKKVHPQAIANRSEALEKLKNTNAADNLLNLFETPVIFYVIGILFFVLKNESQLTIILMWIYVAARYAHSFIQCTYNKVMHRFYAFATSLTVLVLLLINLLRAI